MKKHVGSVITGILTVFMASMLVVPGNINSTIAYIFDSSAACVGTMHSSVKSGTDTESNSDTKEVITDTESNSDTKEVITDTESNTDTEEVITDTESNSDTEEVITDTESNSDTDRDDEKKSDRETTSSDTDRISEMSSGSVKSDNGNTNSKQTYSNGTETEKVQTGDSHAAAFASLIFGLSLTTILLSSRLTERRKKLRNGENEL